MKVCAAGYIPPPSFPGAVAFRQNLEKFPAAGDLLLYSEHDYPGTVRLKASPETLKGAKFIEGINAGKPNVFALHNGLFLAAAKIARSQGFDYMLYLEADCRVGVAGWDRIIWDEYFASARPLIVAGTLYAYNPSNYSPKAARLFAAEIARPRKHGVPMGCYGWLPAAQKGNSILQVNGALAVYDLLWIERMFDLADMGRLASQNGPFDQAISQRLWDMFGEDAFEVIGSLESCYSGYGDLLTTEADRQELLLSGKVCASHQHKGDFQP